MNNTDKPKDADTKPREATDFDKKKFEWEQDKFNKEHDLAVRKDQFERDKFEKEQKFQLDKLNREQKTEKTKTWVTALSIIIPLMVIAITIWSNSNLQDRQARSDLKLKAAEIVMGEKTTTGTLNKANAMQDLFPEELSNFTQQFEPSKYSISKEEAERARKKEFLQMLVDSGALTTPKEFVNLYVQLFPEDKWINQNETEQI